MTDWREFDAALAQVLVELPGEAVLVVSGRGRLVQFLRVGERMAVEASNDSPQGPAVAAHRRMGRAVAP